MSEDVRVDVSINQAEVYLQSAPKDSPYVSLVTSLVDTIHHLRGTQEDHRTDRGRFPYHLRLTGEGTFEMVCANHEMAEVFAKEIFGGRREP